MNSIFIKYNDGISLICSINVSDFEYDENTYIQIKDCAFINAVTMTACNIWKPGSKSASFAKSPDDEMKQFSLHNGAELSDLANDQAPIDIYNTLYYLL
jgi:hypothetical protein